jgi:hypothetical protein
VESKCGIASCVHYGLKWQLFETRYMTKKGTGSVKKLQEQISTCDNEIGIENNFTERFSKRSREYTAQKSRNILNLA